MSTRWQWSRWPTALLLQPFPDCDLSVVKEDTPVNGIDYFEPELTEKLGDTPVVVARVFRDPSIYENGCERRREQGFEQPAIEILLAVLREIPLR